MSFVLLTGDSKKILTEKVPENTFDACICDPPYGMNIDKNWDKNIPPLDHWKEIFRVLKPGAFCISFCSPQLYHRLATHIEDAGFSIQDMIMWIVTTKMVKSNRLKPAHEPICVAQKPYDKSITRNMEKWNVGRINIEDARIPWDKEPPKGWVAGGVERRTFGRAGNTKGGGAVFGTQDANPNGRYPSNVVGYLEQEYEKYFYAPRVTKKEKGEYNDHPTTKPVDLMAWLVKIFCPKDGFILDPFMGSGSTGLAAIQEKRNFIGIDIDQHYVEIAEKRFQSSSE